MNVFACIFILLHGSSSQNGRSVRYGHMTVTRSSHRFPRAFFRSARPAPHCSDQRGGRTLAPKYTNQPSKHTLVFNTRISSIIYILQNESSLPSTNCGILYSCNPKCYQKLISLLWNIASWFQHTQLRDIFSSDVIVLMNFAFNGITPKSNTVT